MKGPRWAGPECPQDEAHGRLLDWPGETTAWFCPSVAHVGRAFYTTDLTPTPCGAADFAAPPSRVESAPPPSAGKHLARPPAA